MVALIAFKPFAIARHVATGIASTIATPKLVSTPLKEFDPHLYTIIANEKIRQHRNIDLIASENFIPRYCSEALASCLSTKYSEGLPGDRYYAGNEFIDRIEKLCQRRALDTFKLSPHEWCVNVQPLSGSPANFAVFTGLLKPGDKILSLDLPHGGHLSHGFKVGKNKLTATSKYFDTYAYHLDPKSELIDYKEVSRRAEEIQPKVIIAGASAYPRLMDYKRFREIADSVGAILMVDMAHIAGLIAGGVIPSPFDYADIVTTTTHKTLRGPRGALIFSRIRYGAQIDKGVFPACQGGPHNHSIAGIAAALKACLEPEFKNYQNQILRNSQVLAKGLDKLGIRLVAGGTDTHLILADLSNLKGITGLRAETLLNHVGIVTNKNTVLTDKSPKNPSGIRLGSPAMTTRGMKEEEFKEIAELIGEVLFKGSEICNRKKVTSDLSFVETCAEEEDVINIGNRVKEMAMRFPVVESVIWPNSELPFMK